MRGRTLGDVYVVFLVPLVLMFVGAFLLAVVLAQGWGLAELFG